MLPGFKNVAVGNRWNFKKVPLWIGAGTHRAPLTDITLDIESGPDTQHMALTRVALGGVLLGPVGMLLGGMAKKDATHNNLVITFPDGVERVHFTNNEMGAAQRFIEAVFKLQSNA